MQSKAPRLCKRACGHLAELLEREPQFAQCQFESVSTTTTETAPGKDIGSAPRVITSRVCAQPCIKSGDSKHTGVRINMVREALYGLKNQANNFLKTMIFRYARYTIESILYTVDAYYSTKKIRERLRERFIDSEKTLVFIHIGKCGGTTLMSTIADSPVFKRSYDRILRAHLKQPPVYERAHYLVVVRNPIERAVSAFNWRYRKVVEERSQAWVDGEREALQKYGTLNQLAEALYLNNELCAEVAADFERISHLHARISFYLSDFLLKIDSSQVRFVLSQETLDSDIQRNLCVENVNELNKNSGKVDAKNKQLTAAAYANLKRYLKEDYLALEQLLRICSTTNASKEILLKQSADAIQVESVDALLAMLNTGNKLVGDGKLKDCW